MTKIDGSFQIDGPIDGDQLAAPTSTKLGGVKETGTPSGKFYKDDDTWADPAGTASDITTTLVHAADSKTTPVDADEVSLLDSIATFGLKKLTWVNIKATLKTYFDTIYAAATHNQAAGTINSGTFDAARIPSLPASIITSGTFDGNRLPVMSSAKSGSVPATGTPSGKLLNDYGAWIVGASGTMPFKTVGITGSGANYECDGTADDVQLNAALATGLPVIFIGTLNIAATVKILTNYQQLYGYGQQSVLNGVGAVSPILQIGDSTHQVYSPTLSDFAITRTIGGASKTGTIGLHLYDTKGYDYNTPTVNRVFVEKSETNVKLGENSASKYCIGPNLFQCQFGGFASQPTPDKYGVLMSRAIDVHFLQCSFRGHGGTGSAGLASIGFSTNDVFVNECYFGSIAEDYGYAHPAYNIYGENIMVLRVFMSQFERGDTAAIYCKEGLDILIQGNGFGGAAHNGIHINTITGPATRVKIVGNSFGYMDASATGVFVGKDGGATDLECLEIVGNDFHHIATGINIYDTVGGTITGNTCHATTTGIVLQASASRIAVVGNTIQGTLTNSGSNNFCDASHNVVY
jgi:parallel beta-helix repeat protein